MDLTDDDRATMLGAMMEAAGRLRGADDDADPAQLRARWRRAGMRVFAADRGAAAAAGVTAPEDEGTAGGISA